MMFLGVNGTIRQKKKNKKTCVLSKNDPSNWSYTVVGIQIHGFFSKFSYSPCIFTIFQYSKPTPRQNALRTPCIFTSCQCSPIENYWQ